MVCTTASLGVPSQGDAILVDNKVKSPLRDELRLDDDADRVGEQRA
jgi:hypothetical protein